MAEQIKVTVRYGDRTYHAAVDGEEKADQLLMRSLYHFGIEPTDKTDFRLAYGELGRGEDGVVLGWPIGGQVIDGEELRLEADVAGDNRMSTGSY